MSEIINNNRYNTRNKTKDLVLTSLAIGLVYVATAIIGIKIPTLNNGGLIHLGTAMHFIMALMLGSKKGAIAGGVGMGLFDLFSEFVIWTPTTVITRVIVGLAVGSVACVDGKQGFSTVKNIVAMLIGGLFLIAGYYVGEAITFGNWIIPAQSIPGNIAQIVVGLPVALFIVEAMKRTKIMDQLN